jgi:hypothetical protein
MRRPPPAGRAAAVLLLLAAAPSGPALAAPVGKPVVLRDPACGVPSLAISDCLEVRATPTEGGGLDVAVTLAAPLAQGMFTCVHVWVDGDCDPKTGIGGNELWFRAAVGSRFRPNAWKPEAPGIPAPMENLRLSYSSIREETNADTKKTSRVWVDDWIAGTPRVEGPTMAFSIPPKVLARATGGYGLPYAIRVQVTTTCSEQPVFLEYRGVDEGLPLVVDGDDRDWSGEPSAADPGDELHPTLRCLDLVRLRVDHDARRLLLCVDTQEPGFADRAPVSPDVSATHTITLMAEPSDAAYESPHQLVLQRGVPFGTNSDNDWFVKGRTVEAALPRAGLDGRVRVLAWSDARHDDFVPDKGTARIDPVGR